MENKKVVILSIDLPMVELEQFCYGLSNMARYLGYEIIICNKEIQSINKKELKDLIAKL